MITGQKVETAFNAFWNHPHGGHAAMRAAFEAADAAAPPNGKLGDASKSIMLKALRQWMKEMRRQTALRGEQ